MNRFILSPPAGHDLDDLIEYLRGLPTEPANRIGKTIQSLLQTVARDPSQGRIHETFSSVFGSEIRSRITGNYVVYYVTASNPTLILAILHGNRDVASIMFERLT